VRISLLRRFNNAVKPSATHTNLGARHEELLVCLVELLQGVPCVAFLADLLKMRHQGRLCCQSVSRCPPRHAKRALPTRLRLRFRIMRGDEIALGPGKAEFAR
jgi:hypothetical protein